MIWLLASRWEAGGLERVQLNLARGFKKRKCSVSIIAGRDLNGPGDNGEVTFIAPRGAWQMLLGLPLRIRRERPRVVVTTSNDIAVWVTFWRRILYPSTAVVVAQHLSLSGPRRAARGFVRLKLELIRWAMRGMLTRSQGLVAVSVALAAEMASELKLPRSGIRVIHNPLVSTEGVQARHISQAWPFPHDDVPVFIYAGRLSPEKRLDLLWEAFVLVRATHPARLLILGQGPEGARVAQWIERSTFQSDCALLGRVEDALPWMARSTALVLPSDYEGFGNVLVEAMSCGVQVIATDCPHGPSEVLGGGQFGQLVPVGDAYALAQAMRNVLNGRQQVAAEDLRERSKAFSIDAACEAYLELFSLAIERLQGRD
ncbi:glycosyltransferase [Stenotrophomonas maltophilia]|nr:glycosyltransferase [Stenotrophomonas maltophilia]